MSLSIRSAAQALNVPESAIRTAIKTGKLHLNAQDLIDDGDIQKLRNMALDAESAAYIEKRDSRLAAEKAAGYALRAIQDEVASGYASKIQTEVKKRFSAWLAVNDPSLIWLADRL